MKLLLVDDDRKLAAAVRRGLVDEGYAVDVAHDGHDGVWMAEEGNYDLVVLDLMLPGMDGQRICQRLREHGDWTPILVLTARDGDRNEADGLDAGADDYLTKPFSFPVLLARIRALLRRAVTAGDVGPVVAGDLRLELATRRVLRGDTEITLTARQFDVLAFLMRRAGQVLSKDQILQGVWPFDFAGDPNIVEVYIRRLRTRIDEPFGRAAIQTVRGAGYRLARDGG